MTIELITKEELNELLEIQKNHPILTYEARGYDTFDKTKMTDEDKVAFKRVDNILEKTVVGYNEFQNFTNKTDKLRIRLQYNYSADEEGAYSFKGVGYVNVTDLHYGFAEDKIAGV
jgi:hypothetical protein